MAETIGQQLQEARKRRGVSLEQAAQATRVRAFYLEALEKDNLASLPSKVQGRGFLRLYASYLGLEAGPLLAAWEGKPVPPSNTIIPPHPPLPKSPSRKVPLNPEAFQAEDNYPDAGKASIAAPTSEPEPKVEILPAASDQAEGEPGPEPEEIHPKPAPRPVSTSTRLPGLFTSKPGSHPEPVRTESAVILEQIGHQLSQQREFLGLSLAEVEKYTKLRLHYIQALENGSMDDLPSTVQGRGMLNNYAAFLNLDADALLLRYADALQLRRMERLGIKNPTRPRSGADSRPVPREFTGPSFLSRLLTPDLIIGSTMVIALVLFVLWGASQIMSIQNSAVTRQTLPPVAEVLIGTPSPSAEAVTTTPGLTETPGGTPIPGEAVTPDAETTGTLTPTTPTPGSGGQEPVMLFTPPSGSSPVQVYVVARQSAWMRVTVDEKVAFQGRVQPGSAYTFAGNNKIELITGNGAALQVFYNQHDLGPSLGQVGQVVQLIFTDKGQENPTATIAPTRTATLPVTATPRAGTPSPTPAVSPTPSPTYQSP